MKSCAVGSVLVLLVGTGAALGDHLCPVGCGHVPAVPVAPLRLCEQPQPPPPAEAGRGPIPSPTLYRREPCPPVHVEGKPKPPLRLFHGLPAQPPLFSRVPPQPPLYRKEPLPPEEPHPMPPRPPLVLFRK